MEARKASEERALDGFRSARTKGNQLGKNIPQLDIVKSRFDKLTRDDTLTEFVYTNLF